MKKLIFGISLLVSSLFYCQNNVETDSVNLRIFNDGKYYIKEAKLKLGGNEYIIKDVWKNKYSDFIKVPYIWINNGIEVTVIVKRMFKYDEWFTVIILPIDHVGEKKIESGNYTLKLKTRLKKKMLKIEQNLIETKQK
jgi:hypothetical protein